MIAVVMPAIIEQKAELWTQDSAERKKRRLLFIPGYGF